MSCNVLPIWHQGSASVFMVEGHVTDPAGVEKLRIYLRSPHRPTTCPQHGISVQIVDDLTGNKIIMLGCCKAFILDELDQISRTTEWLDFYNSIAAAE